MPLFRNRDEADGQQWAVMRARQMTLKSVAAARRSGRHLMLLVPLVIALILTYAYRRELFGVDTPVRVAVAALLLILGYPLARDLGRFMSPILQRRLDDATAGTVAFFIRLTFLFTVVMFSLRIAGLDPGTLAVGGAITAVVFGLAAQQTLGHVIAGLVLISARPFRIGDRVRLQAGGVAGQLEGVVTAIGLLYTSFAQGEEMIMVPNSIVLSAAVVPLYEPAGVDLRARLRPDVLPSEVQSLLDQNINIAMRSEPRISLEEVDSDEVVLRIAATPDLESDGPRLADQILSAISPVTREGATEERLAARDVGPRVHDVG
jgi:small-conductance mechanosensitive channel